MNYPVWYLPEIGGGFLIALIAVLHVFVSHFAVGGGLYLIFSEKKGLRERDEGILAFTRSHARFFLLVTMVFGSITGVGIWFIIALVNPAATSLLIHSFVFGWAAEWVFFVVEITAAFIYFYYFGRMDSSTHLTVGWIYFISAWMSLLLVTGIIGFMLTPGDWPANRSFWVGFFNPSFLPSLVFRTFIAILMAGVYGYLSSAFTKNRAVRLAMTRFSGKWSLVALAGAALSALWYVAVLPGEAKALVFGKSPTITAALQWGGAGVLLLLVITLAAGITRPALNSKPVALLSMACALIVFGSFEWIREAARRPYAINEVIYSNMIVKDEVEDISRQGFLVAAKWVKNRELTEETVMAAGEELFQHQCYACHSLGGFNNDLVVRTATMSYGALRSYIRKIHQLRYFMPPFAGTEGEADALAAFIAGGLHGREIEGGQPGEPGQNSGPVLFEDHCAACHEAGDLGAALAGLPVAEIEQMLGALDEISAEMVPFEGSEQERERLARHLSVLGGAPAAAEAGAIDGKLLFEENCSGCHTVEAAAANVAGWDRAAIRDALDKLNELVEEMPPYEGTAAEKEALADYLDSLKGGN